MDLNNAYKLLHYGSLALARAEQQGIRVDMDYCARKKQELTETIDSIESEIHNSKFYKDWQRFNNGRRPNVNSNDQLAKYLYKGLKLKPLKRTASGKGSTDQEALESLQIKEVEKLLRARKLKKARDTYLDSFMREAVDGYIHPFFNLHNVRTYRSSSDSPNFQNIPNRDDEVREITRRALFPRPGHQLLEIDYGSIEVRVAACYHKDPTMLKYINNPKSDMHGDMTEQIYKLKYDKSNKAHKLLRGSAKNGFVFPQFYGDYYASNALVLAKWTKLPIAGRWGRAHGIDLGGVTLGQHLKQKGLSSLDVFTQHIRDIEEHFWNTRFPVYNRWKKSWYAKYKKKGYFDSYTGFRCKGVMFRNDVVNYPIQGSAFHCLLWSFIELDRIMRKEGWRSRLIGQVHDSIMFDIYPPELDMILETAKRVTCIDLRNEWKWIITPLIIEAELCQPDESWFCKEEIKI